MHAFRRDVAGASDSIYRSEYRAEGIDLAHSSTLSREKGAWFSTYFHMRTLKIEFIRSSEQHVIENVVNTGETADIWSESM